MEAFLTGSHVYGKPTVYSDIDLVIRVSPETKQELLELSGGGYQIKFGNLNLITATTDAEYDSWVIGKQCVELMEELGERLNRDTCLDLHNQARLRCGVVYRNSSGE